MSTPSQATVARREQNKKCDDICALGKLPGYASDGKKRVKMIKSWPVKVFSTAKTRDQDRSVNHSSDVEMFNVCSRLPTNDGPTQLTLELTLEIRCSV